MKSCRVGFILGCFLISLGAFAQRGKITKPGSSVLDPNQDGYVSFTAAGFSNDGYYVDEFEIPMFGIPIVADGEVLNDNQAGAKCGTTDLTVDSKGFAVYGVLTDDQNLIFRFRVANDQPSVEAYTIMIDTDGLIGPDDPNATPDNPGFEIDITLIKNANKGVFVYDIDGIESCPSPEFNYSFATHFQIAVADILSCSNPDYFYDFYVPLADLTTRFGIGDITELRFVAVTNVSATCAMSGKISDVGGVDDTMYGGCNSCAFLDLVTNQCPTALMNLCTTCQGFLTGVTPKPAINVPLKSGDLVVTGTSESGADIYLDVYDATKALKDQDTVAAALNGSWAANLTAILQIGDSVTARAHVSGKCQSGSTSLGTSFAIVIENQQPQLSASGSLTYIENQPAVALFPGIVITDPDDTEMESVTVSFTTNYRQAEDIITYTLPPGLTASYNSVTGTLTVTGSALTGDYQTFLRSIRYRNGSENPSSQTRSLDVIINDGALNSNASVLTLNITPVNDPPVVTGTTNAVNYGSGTLVVDNTLSIADVDNTQIAGAVLVISSNYVASEDVLGFTNQNGIVGSYNAGSGVLTLSGTSTLANYTTALAGITFSTGFASEMTRTVTVTANDGIDDSSPFAVLIVVQFPNRQPEIVDDSNNPTDTLFYSIDEDMMLDTCVVAIDPDNDAVMISAMAPITATGNFSVVSGLCFTYHPDPDFFGQDRATLTVCDPGGLCDDVVIVVDVQPVNDAPMVTGTSSPVGYTSGTVTLDNSLAVTDVDNTQITSATVSITSNFATLEDMLGFTNQNGITGVFDPATGILSLTGTATLANYSTALASISFNSSSTSTLTRIVSVTASDGTDSSTPFRISVDFPGNFPPVIIDDGGNSVDSLFYVIEEDMLLDTCVIALDPDGDDLLIVSIVPITTDGIFTATSGLCFTYTPNPDFFGQDRATLTVCDPGGLCDDVVIVVDVISVNDPPVVSGMPGPVNYDGGAMIVDNTLTVTDADDTELESATLSITSNYAQSEDLLDFTDQNGITGSFDSSVGILTLIGTATTADYSSALASIVFSSSSIATSTRTISVTANDGTDDSSPFAITVSLPGNNPPEVIDVGTNPADSLFFSVNEDNVLDTCIVAIDPDGDNVIISSLSPVSGPGLFNVTGDLCFTYTPDPDFFGQVIAELIVCDDAPSSLCDTVVVVIDVLPVNDPPVIDISTVTVDENSTTEICISITDIENDPGVFHGGASSEGTIIDPQGGDLCFDFTPDQDFTGDTEIVVEVCDLNDNTVCSTATIPVVVIPAPNNPPVTYINGIPGDTLYATTPEDTPLVLCFESIDPDGDDVSFGSSVNLSGLGDLEIFGDIEFCFTYTPTLNFNGQASWKVTVCDDGTPSLCGDVVLIIDVTPVNDPPVAVADTITVLRYVTFEGNVLTNDYDPDGDPLEVQANTTGPYHGQAFFNADGSFNYVSDRTFRGADSLRYTVCDNAAPAACSEGVVLIMIEDLPLKIYQGLTPNGDGSNDFLQIDGIDFYTNNSVRIFDRFDNVVFEVRGYNNETVKWAGESNRGIGRKELPEGTYFYLVDPGDGHAPLSGFVILKRQ